ncbi:sororin [Ahaetulla prasina]|uniref:sororin n=1 Tax=Ahaetulla prasina TaxID=499056 RepID=UPI0026484321|nr:sororin [Ahaetulla prasina]
MADLTAGNRPGEAQEPVRSVRASPKQPNRLWSGLRATGEAHLSPPPPSGPLPRLFRERRALIASRRPLSLFLSLIHSLPVPAFSPKNGGRRLSGRRPDVTSGGAVAGDFNGAEKRLQEEEEEEAAVMAGGRPGRRARSAGEAREGAASSPPRRRSERNLPSSTRPVFQGNPSGVARKTTGTPRPGASIMRTITLRKIKPRNQQDQVKESDLIPRRSPRISLKENKENSPPATPENQSLHGGESPRKPQPFTPCCSLNLDAENSPKETNALSPVSANTPGSSPECERDLTMAKRVRRSYSRLDVSLSRSFTDKPEFPSFSLAGTSTPAGAPGKRQTLFGFEKLLLPGELAEPSTLHLISAPKAVEESGAFRKPDTDIPGISFCREKRRKKKVPEFDKSKMDEWAAQMNAEFEEAEKFDLLVE